MSQMTMSAMAAREYGPASGLVPTPLPRPQPGPGDVLIRVEACGVNPLDWKVRSGAFAAMMSRELPLVPGWDVAGVIEAVGEDVASEHLGRAIVVLLDVARQGAYAPYAVTGIDRVVDRPSGLDAPTAAAVPIPGLTALQAVREHARVGSGERIGVLGAAGNVGGLALQFAAAIDGARAVALIRPGTRDRLPPGVDAEVVEMDATASPQPLDVLVDCVGGEPLRQASGWLAPGARLVSVAEPLDVDALARRGIEGRFVAVRHDAEQLACLLEAVASGRLVLPPIRCMPLAEAASAHAIGEAGQARGKLVLVP